MWCFSLGIDGKMVSLPACFWWLTGHMPSMFTWTVSWENANKSSVLWFLCLKVPWCSFSFSPFWAACLPGLQKELLPFLFTPAWEWSLPLPPLWAIPSYSFSAGRTHQNESEGLARLPGTPGDLHGDVPWKRWAGVLDHQSAALASPKGEGPPGSSPTTSFCCPGGVYNCASFTGLFSWANFHQPCLADWGASTGTDASATLLQVPGFLFICLGPRSCWLLLTDVKMLLEYGVWKKKGLI